MTVAFNYPAGSTLIDELIRRITNLDRTTALAALNRAQKWCLRQGTFQFQQAAPVTLTITAQVAPQQAARAVLSQASNLPPMDAGKAKMMLNPDGSPVVHVPWSDFWSALNFNLPASVMYDAYTVMTTVNQTDVTNTFYFFPNVTGTTQLYYHKMSTELTDSATSFSTLPPDFSDLLVDLAEAEERRIYDVGDTWQLLMQRSQDQIKVLLDGYRSETIQPTSLSDAQAKIQESTQLGRA